MKKVLVVLVVLTVALGGLFADIVFPVSDTLTFYGKIAVGNVIFEVDQTSSSRIDLANDANVQMDGPGVKIGEWMFAASSQPSDSQYTISYDYDEIVSSSTSQSFEFEVLENIVTGGDSYSGYDIEFGGSVAIKTDVLVRLLEAVGEDATPAADFEGLITITLTKN